MTYKEMKETPVWPLVEKVIKDAFEEDDINLEDLIFEDNSDGRTVDIYYQGTIVANVELIENKEGEKEGVDPQLN